MPRTSGLLLTPVLSPQMGPNPGALAIQAEKLPPYLWYESGVLWAGQSPAQVFPLGFDSHDAFKDCMRGNVVHPAFPQMAGPFATSFLVASFKYNGGPSCILAVTPSMAENVLYFCRQNGIKQPAIHGAWSAESSAVPSSGAGYLPYPASLFISVPVQSPSGKKTVSPKYIICCQWNVQATSLFNCIFGGPNNRGEI
jgi:hypothetical protein